MQAYDEMLGSYDYRSDATLVELLHAADRRLYQQTLQYGASINRFGRQLAAHQGRVARDGAAFLRHLGQDERTARNFHAAMLFHDTGKLHEFYTPEDWSLAERPTAEQKARLRRHARLGAEMLDANPSPALADHPHIIARRLLALTHHERLDGSGPEGMDAADLPLFAQIACLADAYDGDRIARPHQSGRRSAAEALARLADPSGKYDGAFDPNLLRAYIDWKRRAGS